MTQLLEDECSGVATRRPRPSVHARSSDAILMNRVDVWQRTRWAEVVTQLIVWRDQTLGVETSAIEARQLAVTFACALASIGYTVPSRVGISVNGGIAFEWERGEDLMHLEFLDSRHAEYTRFQGTKLVSDVELVWDPREQEFVSQDF